MMLLCGRRFQAREVTGALEDVYSALKHPRAVWRWTADTAVTYALSHEHTGPLR